MSDPRAEQINAVLRANGFKTELIQPRKLTLFEEGLAFIYLFLGWLWECASRVFGRGKG